MSNFILIIFMLMFVTNVIGYICDCYCPYFVGIISYYSCTTATCTQGCRMSAIDACSSSLSVMG